MMKWRAQAPANIALIKYMGKTHEDINQASNSSLSYTLNHLTTTVELELIQPLPASSELTDQWQPLQLPDNNQPPLQLSTQGQQRFINHLAWLKQQCHCDAYFIVRSCNNFPADCGLASSASSYAALTKAACIAFAEINQQPVLTPLQQANLSRHGSGSSCRSLFEPWCLWQGDAVMAMNLETDQLLHQVIIVSQQQKAVSSSAAHQRVTRSLLFAGRCKRAETRLQQLCQSLRQRHWQQSYEICWQEFWDMHSLFETAQPSFGYINEDSFSVLTQLRNAWQQQGDGPLITMDAGPNIHLLYRPDQLGLAQHWQQHFSADFTTISSFHTRSE